MNTPKQSFLIWFTMRTGSTLLCETIANLGFAGKPGEHLSIFDDGGLRSKYNVDTYRDLQHALWTLGSSSNGVFGVKYGPHASTHFPMLRELESFPDANGRSGRELFDGLFPNCSHIYLTRIHKVRQIVSWWKAIQDSQWHLKLSETQDPDQAFFDEKYDLPAFRHLFAEISLRETLIADELLKRKVDFLSLTYESFIQDLQPTVQTVLEYLGIEHDVPAIEAPLKKTSNALSSIWVNRLREDLQDGWDKPAW